VALDDSDMKVGSWDGVVSSSVSALLAGTSAMTEINLATVRCGKKLDGDTN